MSNFSVYTRIIDWLYVAFVYMSMSTIRHDCCSKAENEENKNMNEQGLLDDVSTTITTDSWHTNGRCKWRHDGKNVMEGGATLGRAEEE
jgi:hypothetical protein